MSGIQAVVFDLDGVIIDTEEVWEEVRRAYVAEHGRQFLPDSQQQMMGMSTPEWSRHLAEDVGVGLPSEQVASEVLARMAERYRADLPLIPGSVDAVRRIAAAYPVALASSSARILIDQVLATAGLAEVFRVTLSTEEVPRGKPAPDVYQAAVSRLGLDRVGVRGGRGLQQRPALGRGGRPGRGVRAARGLPAGRRRAGHGRPGDRLAGRADRGGDQEAALTRLS